MEGESGMNKRKLGQEKEQAVEEYLRAKGYEILARNFRNRFGEIDLIAKDAEIIVFVEVKYRSVPDCGMAAEAVDRRKQKTITNVARYYLMTHGGNEWTPCRFDVLAVDGDVITHILNAFYAGA